jgi:hypothetical protein
MVCPRRAWLTLGSLSRELEDRDAGYFCTNLDLGYPEARAVVTNRPDHHGADDRTTLFGGRVISANLTAAAGAGASIDQVATSFAPFMMVEERPELHYILDRPGLPERVMTVRAANYSWPIAGPNTREVQLQWFAADPAAYGPTVHSATATTGASTNPGREYPLEFPRHYPAGGSFPVNAEIASDGELGVKPLLQIFGPVNAPRVVFASTYPDGSTQVSQVPFADSLRLDPSDFVEVDTDQRTAFINGDRGLPALRDLDWINLRWPRLPALPVTNVMSYLGFSTTEATRCVASWRDSYLT